MSGAPTAFGSSVHRLPSWRRHPRSAKSSAYALSTARCGLTGAAHDAGLPVHCTGIASFHPTTTTPMSSFASPSPDRCSLRPGSRISRGEETLEAFLETGVTVVPTFTISDANRDLMPAPSRPGFAATQARRRCFVVVCRHVLQTGRLIVSRVQAWARGARARRGARDFRIRRREESWTRRIGASGPV